MVSGPREAKVTKVRGGVCKISQIPASRLYVDGPLGAKKKQGSGRSPEILTPNRHAQWISAITYGALEL